MPEGNDVELTLTSDERILFQGRAVPLEKLALTLREATVPSPRVTLKVDSKAPFSLVLRVMEILQSLSNPVLLAS